MLGRVFRTVALIGAVIAGLSVAGHQARAADPTAFVQGMANQAIGIIKNQSETKAQRKAQFSTLFDSNFDVPTIGKFVLGIYWRRATPEQQQEYLKVFGQYVVAIYADRFSNYTGETFKTVGAKSTSSDATTVTSVINRTGGAPPVHVDWVLVPEGGSYKVVDVVVENLSMRLTQRDEFASVIEHNGGSVDALIKLLKQKVQQS